MIQKVFNDSENVNADEGFLIEAVHDTCVVMINHSEEDKTTKDFSVGNKNNMNLEEINYIEHKNRCVSRTKEREINQ